MKKTTRFKKIFMGFKFRRIPTYLQILYFYLIYWFRGISAVCNKLRLVRSPGPILKAFGAQIGEGTLVYPGIVIHAASGDFSNLIVGKNCRIMTEAFLDLTNKIILEDNTCIGIRTTLITHLNAAKSPLNGTEIKTKDAPIVFEDGAVSYTNSTILHGVTLGKCSIVGAGAVATKNVAPYTIVFGNPARLIKKIDFAKVLD